MSIRYKDLSVCKIGWKRVAKNICHFGWRCTDAYEVTSETRDVTETTIRINGKDYVNVDAQIRSKTRVDLYFVRDSRDFTNLPAIFLIELLFNIVFNIRRFIGFLLPIYLGISALLFGMGGSLPFDSIMVGLIAELVVLVWILLMVFEKIFAVIGGKILRYV